MFGGSKSGADWLMAYKAKVRAFSPPDALNPRPLDPSWRSIPSPPLARMTGHWNLVTGNSRLWRDATSIV